jgi:hypothetical protein
MAGLHWRTVCQTCYRAYGELVYVPDEGWERICKPCQQKVKEQQEVSNEQLAAAVVSADKAEYLPCGCIYLWSETSGRQRLQTCPRHA